MNRKLSPKQINRHMGAINTALTALHLGVVHWDHCHDLIAHYFIAKSLATIVPKHNHLLPYIDRSLLDLYDLLGRSKEGPTSISDQELASIDLSAEIFEAMLKTSSLRAVRNAIREVNKQLTRSK